MRRRRVTSSSAIGQIVVAEANALGMSATKRNAFLAKMETRSKGGSYDICGTSCNPYTYIRTVGGRITIPSKSGAGATILNNYVYGRFADGLNIPCQVKGASETTAQVEARCAKYKNANAGTEQGRVGDVPLDHQVRAEDLVDALRGGGEALRTSRVCLCGSRSKGHP